MARFLMMPHSPAGTLAHLAACSAVGTVLRERGHDVHFAHGGSNAALLEDAGFTWHPVRESHGPMNKDWFHDAADLEGMLASQLEVIKELRPHVCVTSAGIGRLAAEVSSDTTRHLAMHHNLAQSAYGRRALRAWKLRYDLRRPRRLVRDIRTRVKRPSEGLKAVRRASAEVRAAYGLPPLDDSTLATGVADAVACTSAPFLDPQQGMPAHWRYTGPISYAPPGPGVTMALDPARPRAYVSQGSTGSADLLRSSVAELAEHGFAVVVGTAHLVDPGQLEQLGEHVYAAPIVDGRAELGRAAVAVLSGGHMTAMEAMLAGTPTVIANHTIQQAAAAQRADRLGTGIGLWPRRRPGDVGRAAARILDDGSYRRRAREIADRLADGWDGALNTANIAEELSS